MIEVKSFEEACELRGYDAKTVLPDVSGQPEWLQKITIANTKRLIIAEAIKEGKHPKVGTWRWFPVFSAARGGFVYSFTGCTGSYANLGARLEFNTETESDYFGSNFIELHKEALEITE